MQNKIITPPKKPKRNASIELLRIISMLLVMLVHYNWPLNGRLNVEMFNESVWKFVGCASLNSLDFVCVNCFIIISGYFGIIWKLKSLLNFLFQIGFWGGLLYLICWGLGNHAFQPLVMVKQMTCFLFGVNWFFIAYLGLYLIAPILNSFIEKSTERQLGVMVLAFYAFQTLFGWLSSEAVDFHAGMSTMSFTGIYLLGAYLKKSQLKWFQWSAMANLAVYLGVGVFCVLISLVAVRFGLNKSIYSYISPLQIIQTIYLFLFCKSLSLQRAEKIVLFFSSSAFAALLMHSWEDGSWLYYTGLHWIYDNIQLPFFAAMGYIVLYFITACCLDKLRVWCWYHTLAKCFK